jgi:diguanylate cyclase (GGDEF)-like protein
MPEGTSAPEQSSKGLRSFIERAKEIQSKRNQGPKDAVLRTALERSQQESEIDPLTGAFTQKGFDKRLELEKERAIREGNKIAIVFFDLNGLKRVNDELGHDVGDEYIKIGYQILVNSFRPTDLIARRGNKADEFIVAVPLKEMDIVKDLHERVDQAVNAVNQNWLGFEIVFPAGAHQLDFENTQESISLADHAMYQAKSESKITNGNVLNIGGNNG